MVVLKASVKEKTLFFKKKKQKKEHKARCTSFKVDLLASLSIMSVQGAIYAP